MPAAKLSKLLIDSGALRFGSFVTKSGRESPYFLNFGDICDGAALQRLADLYAALIMRNFDPLPDVIFGPAYKGIPLAVSIATSLSRKSRQGVSFSFDRKESKAHGEGGLMVGRQITANQRVVIVDDVLTSGLSISHSIDFVGRTGAKIAGIVVGVDRCELAAVGITTQTAAESTQQKSGCKLWSLATIDEVTAALAADDSLKKAAGLSPQVIESITAYRKKFGIA